MSNLYWDHKVSFGIVITVDKITVEKSATQITASITIALGAAIVESDVRVTTLDDIAISWVPFTVQRADASALTITNFSLPAGTVGSSYDEALSAAGGREPWSWSLVSGSLPPWLKLYEATGIISCIPTAVGTFDFTVQMRDGAHSLEICRSNWKACRITRPTRTRSYTPGTRACYG